MKKIIETLGNRLGYHRGYSGLSTNEVALLVGVSRNLLTRWEKDKSVPTPAELDMLAKLYKVTSAWLIDGHENATGDQGSVERVISTTPVMSERARFYATRLELATVIRPQHDFLARLDWCWLLFRKKRDWFTGYMGHLDIAGYYSPHATLRIKTTSVPMLEVLLPAFFQHVVPSKIGFDVVSDFVDTVRALTSDMRTAPSRFDDPLSYFDCTISITQNKAKFTLQTGTQKYEFQDLTWNGPDVSQCVTKP